MLESSRYFKDHTEQRISEIQERVRNFKAEKIKEKIRKTKENQDSARRQKKKKIAVMCLAEPQKGGF